MVKAGRLWWEGRRCGVGRRRGAWLEEKLGVVGVRKLMAGGKELDGQRARATGRDMDLEEVGNDGGLAVRSGGRVQTGV